MIKNDHKTFTEGTTTQDVLSALNRLAPPELAEEWDNIGMQIGNLRAPVSKVLVSLDVTPAVIDEAADNGCQLIISHHPLIFTPFYTLRDDCPEQSLINTLVRQEISLLVAHTNLDAAPGGVADCLAEKIGLDPESCDKIGKYGRYSIHLPIKSVHEWKKEIHMRLHSEGCRINSVIDKNVRSMAVFPGSFPEEIIPDLCEYRPELILCGEIKHHVGLMLSLRGIMAIDAGHDVTEKIVLAPLARNLSGILPKIKFTAATGIDYNRKAF